MSGKIAKSALSNLSKDIQKPLERLKHDASIKDVIQSNSDLINLKNKSQPSITPNIYQNDKFKLEEIYGDLFSVNDQVSLAHCVSTDLAMGKGIAKIFKEKFKRVNELKSQNAKVGDVAFIKLESRFVFYLVTKEKYYQKPTYDTLRSSLLKMKDLIEKNEIKELGIPRLGCGLDKLKWKIVKSIIIETFKSNDLSIKCFELNNK